MSDTPETDGEWNRIACYDHPQFEQGIADFARKLERERDDLRAIFPKVLEALESGACAATCSVDFLREIPREVKLVRQRLERERDEARFDLAFRRELYVVQELKLSESRKTIAELQNTIRVLRDDSDVIVEDRDYWRAEAKRWQQIKSEP